MALAWEWDTSPYHPIWVKLAEEIYDGDAWYLPLWVPLVLVGISTACFARAARPAQAGRCSNCDYDLSGAPGPVCPECGRSAA